MFRLLEHELLSLDEEQEGEPSDPEAAVEAAGPVLGPRDVTYYVRTFDAALLAIDGADLDDVELSLAGLLALRERALQR